MVHYVFSNNEHLGEILITLAHVGINIYLISQGASEVNISFVVKEEHVMQAINVIHSEILDIPETVQQTAFTGKNGIRGMFTLHHNKASWILMDIAGPWLF
jgi:hypothetical protein